MTDDAEEAGIGVGVGHRMKGLEEVVVFDVFESMELLLSVLDCRDLRRKGTEGSRYVGNTEESA